MSRELSAEESAAKEVVRLLNNVLSSHGMCIEMRDGECGVRVSKEAIDTYKDSFVGGWQTVGQMLLSDDNYVSVFRLWTYGDDFIDDTYLNKRIAELGMRSLAGCKSFAELELKLCVMFPEMCREEESANV